MGVIRNRNWLIFMVFFMGCASGGDVVTIKTVSRADIRSGLGDNAAKQLEEIKKSVQTQNHSDDLTQVIQKTPSYSVEEYLKLHATDKNTGLGDYRVGGLDVLDITVYEELDLSRKAVRISTDGYISYPLIGRLKVDNLTTSEVENLITKSLADGQYLREAHVSVIVVDYKSKQFIVLGSVKTPGTYPLMAQERVLDAISHAGGIDFEKGGNRGMIIRTENAGKPQERKVVIRIDLPGLLKGGNQISNLLLTDKDHLYFPSAEPFFIIGQVEKPGSYLYREHEITIVEAISMAGGFTRIASRNRTRILRMEDGVEKIIEVRVDQITDSGKKTQDIIIKPGDVIVIPESIF
jgi:polysaccharide export outer membrane protein